MIRGTFNILPFVSVLATCCYLALIVFIFGDKRSTKHMILTREAEVMNSVLRDIREERTSPKGQKINPNLMSEVVKCWFKGDMYAASTLKTSFHVLPLGLCPKNDNEELDYLIMVFSSVMNFANRKGVRDTFGRRDLIKHTESRVVFLVGQPADASQQPRLDNEIRKHGDILQGAFTDSPHNNSLKGVMGLRWVALHCPRVKYVIKVQEEAFVNMFMVTSFLLPKFRNKQRHIGCIRPDTLRIERSSPNQDMSPKLKTTSVRENQFEELTEYPFEFCQGGFVLLTGDLISPMLQQVEITPFVAYDDVYLFGLLPFSIHDVTYVPIRSYMEVRLALWEDCVGAKGALCPKMFLLHEGLGRSNMMYCMTSLLVSLTPEINREFKLTDFKFNPPVFKAPVRYIEEQQNKIVKLYFEDLKESGNATSMTLRSHIGDVDNDW